MTPDVNVPDCLEGQDYLDWLLQNDYLDEEEWEYFSRMIEEE